MRLLINIFGKNDWCDKIQNRMRSSEENNNLNNNTNNNMNNDDSNNNNLDCNNTSQHHNDNALDNSNNSNKNIMASILNRIMPPLAAFRSQPVKNVPRTHSFRCGRANSNTIVNNNNNSNDNSDLPIQPSDLISSSNSNSTTPFIANPSYSTLDINSNITAVTTIPTFKHKNSLADDTSDLDDDNDVNKRRQWRKSFPRSDSIPSMEDSGFSSSNCQSDDKDDIAGINTSFDCEDGISKHDSRHPFPLSSVTVRMRARTFSMDSTSSDQSDTNTSSSSEENSKLSSSLPFTSIHNDNSGTNDKTVCSSKRRTLSSSENAKPSSAGVVRKRSLRLKIRRNTSSSKPSNSSNSSDSVNDVTSPTTTLLPPQPLHTNESDAESEADDDYNVVSNSDHNNNCPDVTCKNLSSGVDAVAPFRFSDFFGGHGLVTLIACIVYTLFLVFVCGGLALIWTILKKCVNKSDLKDLRENLKESRRRREMVVTPTSILDGGS